jgi:ribosomal protein S18 acetylase RimI-like enzyme
MDMDVSVARITELPADLDVLIELSHKEAFGAVRVLRDQWLDGSNRFSGPGEALLEARADEGGLLGCGLNIDPYSNDPGTGRLRHLFVHPSFRRRGIATALVAECIHLARPSFTRLRLRTDRDAAIGFYAALGFRESAESDCTHVLNLG